MIHRSAPQESAAILRRCGRAHDQFAARRAPLGHNRSVNDPPPASTSKIPWWRRRTTLGTALCLAAGLGVFVADVLWKRIPSGAVMTKFVGAVRGGRTREAHALAGSGFRQYLEAPVDELPAPLRDTDQARTLILLRNATEVTTNVFVGEWTAGCIHGEINGNKRFAALLHHVDGSWRIDDLRSEVEPGECKELNSPGAD
jgi:hypothetical protein